jgi:hypothetical protein
MLSHEKLNKYGNGLTTNIKDYEIIRDIGIAHGNVGGVEDISFLTLAYHIPTEKTVCLKLTDFALSYDYEFVEEIIVTKDLIRNQAKTAQIFAIVICCHNMSHSLTQNIYGQQQYRCMVCFT